MVTDFAKQYELLSNVELLLMLDEKAGYLPEAVEAMEAELARRDITEAELQEAGNIISDKAVKMARQQRNKMQPADLIRRMLEPQTSFRPAFALNALCITMLTYLLYNAIPTFGYVIRTYSSYGPGLDNSTRVVILLYAYELTGIYVLYRRKKAGWLMIVLLQMTVATIGVIEIADAFIRQSFYFTLIHTGIALLFAIAILFLLCKKELRALFSVDKKMMQWTMAAGAAIGLLLLVVIRTSS
jgi:hypothetical protein